MKTHAPYTLARHTYHASDLWIEFPFPREYLRLPGSPKKASKTSIETVGTTQETTQITIQETTQEMIIKMMLSRASITRKELLQLIVLTDAGVKYHLDQLRKKGRIRHPGSTKSGHWEVLK